MDKIILITGATSGFGKAMAECQAGISIVPQKDLCLDVCKYN